MAIFLRGHLRRKPFTSLYTQTRAIDPLSVGVLRFTESGRVVYSVDPLHAEILLAHRLAYRSHHPRSGGLRLYNDTFLSEVHAVLSRRPEDIDLPASFGR
ncbi:hypothetical protein [Burkholderia multivorans]|uniref:hypothetical protein n=1 Tax=Burkholderia multivorans TaxID=87883 RepID=UPI0034428D13